jgi:hypothetical protein
MKRLHGLPERQPQLLQAQPHPTLDRAGRELEQPGNLAVGEPAEVRQLDHTSLLARKLGQRAGIRSAAGS